MDNHIYIPEQNQYQIHQQPSFCEDFVPDIELINLLIEELPDIDHETSGKDAFHDDTPLVKLEEEIYFAGGEPLIMEEHYWFSITIRFLEICPDH